MGDRGDFLRDYLRNIEEESLPELRAWLSPLENGEMRLGERRGEGAWTDTTQREIDRTKKSIAQYEKIADNLRRRVTD
jgi:hypothetical protein